MASHQLTAYLSEFYFIWLSDMTVLSEVCKQEKFELHNPIFMVNILLVVNVSFNQTLLIFFFYVRQT